MQLVQNQTYNSIEIDFYVDNAKNIYVTIDQLAKGFGYKYRKGLDNLINRHDYLKDPKFSVPHKVRATDGKYYETRLFNKRGITEIGMLSRTEQGKVFRQWIYDYIEQLEKENYRFKLQRALEKPIRKSLTDAIKEWPYCNTHSYKHFTDLLLKKVTGQNAKQLKLARPGGATSLDLLTALELEQYIKVEQLAISLIGLSFSYDQIKQVIYNAP